MKTCETEINLNGVVEFPCTKGHTTVQQKLSVKSSVVQSLKLSNSIDILKKYRALHEKF